MPVQLYGKTVTPIINPLAIVMLASCPLVAPSLFATGYVPSADVFGARYRSQHRN